MLEMKAVFCSYGDIMVLRDFNFSAKTGEVTCIMGRNGVGKTTCLKTIMGLLPVQGGEIYLQELQINKLLPYQIPKQGIGYVPQGRGLFAEMSVRENIEIGLGVMVAHQDPDARSKVYEKILNLFPILRNRLRQRAGTLSGGEQQMLSMARALALEPKLLLLDEPTEGLQPSMIDLIGEVVLQLKKHEVAVVLVEQKIDCVMALADRVAFVENGYSREIVDIKDLTPNSPLLTKYIGVS